MHGIPFRSGICRPVVKQQNRSKYQTKHQKWNRSNGGNGHQGAKFYTGKEKQRDRRDSTGGKEEASSQSQTIPEAVPLPFLRSVVPEDR
ncbi:MAG: hypothetical protein ACLSX5_07335 [Lachnospiraceae bacterium]